MSNNAPISQTLKFHFGNKVFCTDGADGFVTRVLFDADTCCLTHVAVKQSRFLGKTYYVPFAHVTQATGDGIWLDYTLEQVAASPAAEGPGVALESRTAVKADSGTGTLVLVAVLPESGALAYLVTHNLVSGRDTLLHAGSVTALTPGQITIAADAATLAALPPYRSDRELQQEVEQIVFDLPFLHIDLKGMNLRVLDGVLYMDGNISSTLRGELTRDQVAGVTGLLEIKNNLVGDDTLAADIAQALGRDERTRSQHIGVYPQLGIVRLSGSVSRTEQATSATELASTFPGVRSVINDLVVDPTANMLYVMSAQEGGEAKDLVPGKFTRHTN